MLERLKSFLIKQIAPNGLVPIGYRGSWWNQLIVHEPHTGAWQRNQELTAANPLTYSAVFSCISLIAGDIGKLRIMLVEQDANGIWSETTSAAFNPVLRKPNSYQNRIRFLEAWVGSKLSRGNTYIFLVRDDRKVVTEMHVLDPSRVQPLVAPNGDVFYQIARDDLAGVGENLVGERLEPGTSIIVPETEIIHDRMNCFFHPLWGLSPLYAGALAVAQGLNIQTNSVNFFKNQSRPSGILSAPGHIDPETAERVRAVWQAATTGVNVGKLIVAGDDLKFQSMTISAEDSQLIEQAKLSAETICSLFHVPTWMAGVAAPPSYNNIEALNTAYYTQCLQTLIESIELCLDEGLGLTRIPRRTLGTELDLDGLLRMDTPTLYKTINDGVGGGWLKPNEGRRRANYAPVPGGDTPYMQQQNFSLAALNKRDSRDDPFKSDTSSTPSATTDDEESVDDAAAAQVAIWEIRRALAA